MEAYRAERLEGIEALARTAIARPEPGPGQVRIAVRATGLHLADAAALAGKRLPRIGPPLTPGFEVSGTVAALGPGVTGLAPGEAVIAFLSSGGGLAEEALAEAAHCVSLPDGLAFGRAAGLPLAYGGVLMALRERAGLGAGETLLVLDAGGQMGLAAIEIGKCLGAQVIAASGKGASGEAAAAQGADHTVDTAANGLGEAVWALTDGRGADVVFDPEGDGATLAALTLAEGARVLCAGLAAGGAGLFDAEALHARDAALIAANVPVMMTRAPERARAALAEVAGWAAAGEIRPRIAARFAFDQAHHALAHVAARRDRGAVVVTLSAG